MAELVAFAIILIGPGVFLVFHGRSLLKRGRGGKLSQRGRLEIIIGLGLLILVMPPFLVGLYTELWRLYYLNNVLFLTLSFLVAIFLILYTLKRVNIFDISLFLRGLLNKLTGKPKQLAHSRNKTTSKSTDDNLIVELHKILDQRFDVEELRTLCVYLNVDYDNLRGQNKSGKARELILYLKRRNKIHRLIVTGMNIRPDIDWRKSLTRNVGEFR